MARGACRGGPTSRVKWFGSTLSRVKYQYGPGVLGPKLKPMRRSFWGMQVEIGGSDCEQRSEGRLGGRATVHADSRRGLIKPKK
ncbi:hypothetical protein CRG98_016360 [Punica granatum]|uniref:Uncharacterized protein n=1 Tax=Punica granatum TaxID=22663 RepID=A0A2I0K3P6_PUNGR|nr:hypothetical protein CRG98_016360 [Punica granatum]